MRNCRRPDKPKKVLVKTGPNVFLSFDSVGDYVTDFWNHYYDKVVGQITKGSNYVYYSTSANVGNYYKVTGEVWYHSYPQPTEKESVEDPKLKPWDKNWIPVKTDPGPVGKGKSKRKKKKK